MRKTTFIFLSLFSCLWVTCVQAQQTTRINLFDQVVFYDGYAATVTEPVAEGVYRVDNTRYTTKLQESDLNQIENTLQLEVTIGALCDNYDRIGGVFLSLVPKSEGYDSGAKQEFEIGRFITPFMHKNKLPNTVPYAFNLDHLVGLFHDENYRENYDYWFDLFVFGVPYAAQTEVVGCSNRNDVFKGTLDLVTSAEGAAQDDFYILPLATKIDFNKYNATDVAGTTTKIFTIEVDEIIGDATFQLITSNHGANQGGEEYVRRDHFVYFNGAEVLTYKPGGKSCEPYRRYNTQGNGIYGSGAKSEAWWLDWNNWCPGDVIPNRLIAVGNLEPGVHEFKISVPDAQFANNEGNFPLSLFMFSKYPLGTLSQDNVVETAYTVYPNPSTDRIYVETQETIKNMQLTDVLGKKVAQTTEHTLDVLGVETGVYQLHIEFENGVKTMERVQVK